MKLLQTLFLLALVFSVTEGGDGGLKLQISQKGLDYAANVALDSFITSLKTNPINDLEGSSGRLKYEFRNIKITDVSPPEVRALFKPDAQQLSWSLSNADIEASLDWKYRYRKNRILNFRDSGNLWLSAKGLSVEVSMKVENDEATGRPVLRTAQCTSRLQDLDVRFRGASSWLYDILVAATESQLTRRLEDELCKAANRALNQDANEELSTLEVENSISNDLVFNFKLVSPPTITNHHIASLHSGCVYKPGHYDCPSTHPAMDKGVEGRMLGLSLSAQALNTWAKVEYLQGDLNATILHSHLQGEHSHYFDTDCDSGFCIVSFLPDVATNYPNSKIEIDVITLAPPTISIAPSTLKGHLEALVKMYVRAPDGERTWLFDVKTSMVLEAIAEMKGSFLRFKIMKVEPTFDILNVNAADLSEEGMEWAMKVAGMVMMNKWSLRGEQGIPLLRMRGVSLENSSLTFEQDYLHLVTDVLYTKPSR